MVLGVMRAAESGRCRLRICIQSPARPASPNTLISSRGTRFMLGWTRIANNFEQEGTEQTEGVFNLSDDRCAKYEKLLRILAIFVAK